MNELIENRTLENGKYEFAKQVHLRFGYFERAEQKDILPANLTVNVNGKPAPLPTPKPTSKPNADIIRPGRSIDITQCIKLAPNMQNRVDMCTFITFKSPLIQDLIKNRLRYNGQI